MNASFKGNVTASDRRVLFTKWVGLAWKVVCRDPKETAVRSFVRCGVTLSIDGISRRRGHLSFTLRQAWESEAFSQNDD